MSRLQDLRSNLDALQARIAAAAQRAGRQAADVRLVAVSKGQPVQDLAALHQLGVRDFGESYLVEALPKQSALGDLTELRWHMIGHVQSRKAADVAAHFDWVHSVDSLRLARKLSAAAGSAGRRLAILLQINPSAEPSKHGWLAHDQAHWARTLPEIEEALQLPDLDIRGLMCMAPFSDTAEQARPYFARTRDLLTDLARRFPQVGWEQLSMGMTNDFEAAIEEGATLVRVGTAVFGARQ